jgi:hypothetical protein
MGEMVFALLAMEVPYWKHLVLIIYLPTLMCILLPFVLTESPRWQILNSKTKDLIENFKNITECNKIKIDNNALNNLDADKLKKQFNIENYERRERIKDCSRKR